MKALPPASDPVPQRFVAYAFTIFLGAFLLFQVQLIMGKYILPWFGGTPTVWTTCLLFFQVLLLAGYAYAHLISSRLSLGMQSKLHRLLLLAAVAGLAVLAFSWKAPILPGAGWRPRSSEDPMWHIVRLLGASVGAPYLLLATTGPLLQHWFAQANPRVTPYRLYALSNFGSLLGLLSYPFVFEPSFTLRQTAWLWSGSFALYALGCGVCAWLLGQHPQAAAASPAASAGAAPAPASHPPSATDFLLWVLLAACASVMLLATTNLICQEVAVIPFLWVVPLSLYLLSFIICFERETWYRRGVFHPLLGAAVVMAALVLFRGENAGLMTQVNLYSAVLFLCCMVCHGELVRLKPSPRHLTAFYLMLSTGGALGGIFVALIAPRIFPGFWEFQIGLWASVLLLLVAVMRDKQSWFYLAPAWLAPAVVLGLILVLHLGLTFFNPGAAELLRRSFAYNATVGGLAVLTLLVFVKTFRKAPVWARFRSVQLVAVAALILLGWALARQAELHFARSLARSRNFYGLLRVEEEDKGTPQDRYILRHGQIIHGTQFQDPRLRDVPTAYYSRTSGIGLLLDHHPRRALTGSSELRVGVVGLGVGTLAAYGRPGDYMRFYEINPAVVGYAAGQGSFFSFLRDSPARIDIIPGDGRLSLERELERGEKQRFDVLVIDAFSSDAVPVHLLTREAMEIYRQHLRGPDSILAFNISNRALDLRPVLVGLAQEFHLQLLRVNIPLGPDVGSRTDWVLLSPTSAPLSIPELAQRSRLVHLDGPPPLWTDDYSNLLQVLK